MAPAVRACAALVLGLLLAMPATAQTHPTVTKLDYEPHSTLFVGNSFFYYNNGIDSMVGGLATAAGIKLTGGTLVGIGGASWKWHDVDSYFRPDALDSFSIADDATIVHNKSDKLFDTAVMMDCSYCAIDPELRKSFFEFAKRHSDTVRRHGATPVFFMTWAYPDRPEMTAKLAEAYTEAGNANNVLVVPAGLAFARVRKDRPDVDLILWDKRHPTPAGTYLAACTVFASLYGRSPAGLKYYGGVPKSVARMLQDEAWAVVQSYYGR